MTIPYGKPVKSSLDESCCKTRRSTSQPRWECRTKRTINFRDITCRGCNHQVGAKKRRYRPIRVDRWITSWSAIDWMLAVWFCWIVGRHLHYSTSECVQAWTMEMPGFC